MKTGNECISSKTRFATKKDAEMYIKKLAEVSVRNTVPTRAYLCSFNSWHLTSAADSYETIKIKKLEEANARALMFEKSEISLKKDTNYLIVKNIALENQLKKLTDLKKANNFLDSEIYFGLRNNHLPQ